MVGSDVGCWPPHIYLPMYVHTCDHRDTHTSELLLIFFFNSFSVTFFKQVTHPWRYFKEKDIWKEID